MVATLSTPQPTFAGFVAWVYGVMGVPTSVLPSDSQSLVWAYDTALAIVNPAFSTVPGPIYLTMVYNLGGDRLVYLAPDAADAPTYKNRLPYWAYTRKQFGVLQFVAGVITSTTDETTSESLTVPDQFKNLTVGQLQLLRTPWGRIYLSYAMDYGTAWGIS